MINHKPLNEEKKKKMGKAKQNQARLLLEYEEGSEPGSSTS